MSLSARAPKYIMRAPDERHTQPCLEATTPRPRRDARRSSAASELFGGSVRYPTVDDIAQASESRRRTFYRYFTSTDAVPVAPTTSSVWCPSALRAAVTSQTSGASCARAVVPRLPHRGGSSRGCCRPRRCARSQLESRRAAQFDALQSILDVEIRESQGRRVDPMVQGLLLAVEGLQRLAEAVEGKIDRPAPSA